jgi:cellulose synthase/poly-beta-1,6-N-acetylglucosamine synthase-like glycosyltransferase
MHSIESLYYILQFVFTIHLAFPLVLLVLYLLLPSKKYSTSTKEYDFAAIITAYKETDIIIPLVDSLQKQDYKNFVIYIVADECDTSILNYKDENIVLLVPSSKIGSKVKSIDYAINNFRRKHNALIIFDSDNLAHPGFLKNINVLFNAGFKAVQGERKAKNLETAYACLDEARDIYYNFYDRQICFQIGSSSAVAGSGMAFDVDLYKSCLNSESIIGGFDKILQANIVSSGNRIAFSKEAVTYDEKVSKSAQVEKQRTRWINSWFKYFALGFGIFFNGLFSFNFNKIIFGFLLLRPPLFIFILPSLLILVINYFVSITLFYVVFIFFAIFILTFLLSLVLKGADKRVWKSLFSIPIFVLRQVSSMFHLKKANKQFLETEHTHLIYIEDVLEDIK